TFVNAVQWMVDNEYTSGCSKYFYCPGDPVTRGQMAAFFNRVLDLNSASEDYFVDDSSSIFEGDINAIAADGITRGCNPPTNNEYCPEKSVTRGQMAAFIRRALGLPVATIDYFSDDNGSVYESDINAIAAAGITRGCGPDSFCPGAKVTRGEMAAFLYRIAG
ncbi:MAG: S-layer homology domain-containing protein, partial [Acidimicrobiia bacterium]